MLILLFTVTPTKERGFTALDQTDTLTGSYLTSLRIASYNCCIKRLDLSTQVLLLKKKGNGELRSTLFFCLNLIHSFNLNPNRQQQVPIYQLLWGFRSSEKYTKEAMQLMQHQSIEQPTAAAHPDTHIYFNIKGMQITGEEFLRSSAQNIILYHTALSILQFMYKILLPSTEHTLGNTGCLHLLKLQSHYCQGEVFQAALALVDQERCLSCIKQTPRHTRSKSGTSCSFYCI